MAQEHVFRDDGYSGASLRRPGLDRLRDAAAGARLDRILITAPDRLARNYVHQMLLVEELQGHGAAVEFLDRPMSQDPHDQLLLQIRGAVAEYERTLITERMRRGRLRKLRAGILLPWTRPPYGYRVDPERPRDPAGVRLDEAEAAVVRDLFAWFVDEGASVCELARRLRSSWHRLAIGPQQLAPLGRARVADQPRLPRPSLRQSPPRATRRAAALRPAACRPWWGQPARDDPAEWIAVATVPAIVDRERFERAQERLAYNQRMARRNNRVHEYLLRGLVSCGHCRRACAGRHVWRGYDYYVCRTKTQISAQSPGEHCPTRHIPGRPLEELVWRDLCEVLAAPEMVVHAMERARGGHWLPQEMQARRANLRRARAGLHQQIERLTEAYLAGVVPLSEYQRRRRDAEARLLALDGQERELTHDADRQAEAARLAAHAEAFCQRVRQGLEQADFRRKRELLELLIDRVIVTGEAVEIRYAIPVGPEGEREPFCLLRTDYQARLPGSRRGRIRQRRPEAAAAAPRAADLLCRAEALSCGHGSLRNGALLGPRAACARA